jgi:hypothetical protein
MRVLSARELSTLSASKAPGTERNSRSASPRSTPASGRDGGNARSRRCCWSAKTCTGVMRYPRACSTARAPLPAPPAGGHALPRALAAPAARCSAAWTSSAGWERVTPQGVSGATAGQGASSNIGLWILWVWGRCGILGDLSSPPFQCINLWRRNIRSTSFGG